MFRILATLGEGGFGTVYKAESRSEAPRVVALKMLHPHRGDEQDGLSRLREEARILGLVRHRAILTTEGVVQLQGRWTLVMEYVPGCTLKHCIAQYGPVPAPAAFALVHEIADALHTAYTTAGPDGEALRILHRDIKPSNIQIAPDGRVKLLDFGIAKAHDVTSKGQTTSRGFGSWEYVAPERLDGMDAPAGDVYALGSVLFEALAGVPLGRASGNPVRHQQRVSEGLATLRANGGDLGQPFMDMLTSMLAYDPEVRPTLDSLRTPPDAATRLSLASWATEVVPGATPPARTSTHDLSPGDVVMEGVEIEEEEDVSDQPSIAPAFGLP